MQRIIHPKCLECYEQNNKFQLCGILCTKEYIPIVKNVIIMFPTITHTHVRARVHTHTHTHTYIYQSLKLYYKYQNVKLATLK